MSDLQCPARLVLLTRGVHDTAAPDAARELATALAHERVAMVYTGPAPADTGVADEVSARLRVPRAISRDLAPDDPDVEQPDPRSAASRLAAELDAIADVHRGETVLVVCPHPVATAALSLRSAGGPPTPGSHAPSRVPGWTVTAVDVDSDGWVTRAST